MGVEGRQAVCPVCVLLCGRFVRSKGPWLIFNCFILGGFVLGVLVLMI